MRVIFAVPIKKMFRRSFFRIRPRLVARQRSLATSLVSIPTLKSNSISKIRKFEVSQGFLSLEIKDL